MLQDFLQYLVKSIVSSPDKVVVEEKNEMGFENLYLSVAPEDMGKVIGKEGRIIRALRDLIRILAIKNNLRANVILKEE